MLTFQTILFSDKMPNKNQQHGKGRPSKAPGSIPLSKQRALCWTCNKELRRDKLIEHIWSSVLWVLDDNGNNELPADPEDEVYVQASETERKHTDYI